ncbi:MAG: hypothetical protein KBO60_16535, partial [Achromobacter sp.]|nr:hypothetical protein [Achromobacter sp.]
QAFIPQNPIGSRLWGFVFGARGKPQKETPVRLTPHGGFLFDDDSSPVVRWTAQQLDTAGLSIAYARPSYAGAF